MLGSDYRELIVPKLDNNAKKYGILIGGIILTVGAIVLALAAGIIWMLIIGLALGFGTWYLFMQERIEYEYIISGDELSVTKIIAQSKRKPMLTVSINKFTAFGNVRDAGSPADSQTLVLACSAQDTAAFYADFDHDSLGQTRLVMTPNDDFLLYLAKHLPRSLGFRWETQEPAAE